MLRGRLLWGAVGYPLWSNYNKKIGFSAKSPLVLSQIYRSDLAITINRLALLDSAIEKQRANSDFYTRALKFDSSMLCSEKPGHFITATYTLLLSIDAQRD